MITINEKQINHRVNCIENDNYLNSFSIINDKFVKIKKRPKSHDFIKLIQTRKKNENNTLITRISTNLDKKIDPNKTINSLIARASLNLDKKKKKINNYDDVSKSFCFPNVNVNYEMNYFPKENLLNNLNYSPPKNHLFSQNLSKKTIFDAMEFTFMQK